MEMRADQAQKFLAKGNKVRIELRLHGREKAFANLSKEKINQFLTILGKLMPYKIDSDLKKEVNGFSMIISKQ